MGEEREEISVMLVWWCSSVVTLIYWMKVLLTHPWPSNQVDPLMHKVWKHKRHQLTILSFVHEQIIACTFT